MSSTRLIYDDCACRQRTVDSTSLVNYYFYKGSKYIKFTIKAPETPAIYEAKIKIYTKSLIKEIEEILNFKIDVSNN